MNTSLKYYLATAIFYICSFVTVLAQETEKKDVNIDVNVKGGGWYTNWWIWGIVAMLFIITIVAVSSRGRRAD